MEETGPVSFVIWDHIKVKKSHANDLKLAEVDHCKVNVARNKKGGK